MSVIRRLEDAHRYDVILERAGSFKCPVPDGAYRSAKVRTIKITDDSISLSNLRYVRDGMDEFLLAPGEYQQLIVDDQLLMSNTPMEAYTNRAFINEASGKVLISGLGLGILPTELAKKASVSRITVIEINQDVISLVEPHLKSNKIEVINADAYTWQPNRGIKYDFAFHDIWPKVSSENLEEMAKLRAHYRKWATTQVCWAEAICRRMKKKEAKAWG